MNRRVGFLWLSIGSDPSYKCLKSFIKCLAEKEDVYIYFDDAEINDEVKSSLSPATTKCIGGRSSNEVARLLHDDGIKILINNFWDRTRGFEVFAKRPCPVAINFMGVPGRYLNRDLFQYAVTDRFLMNKIEDEKLENVERSIVFPRYYQVAAALKDVKPRFRKRLRRMGILGRPMKMTSRELSVIREVLRLHSNVSVVVICSEPDLPRVTDALLDNDLLPEYFDRVKTAYQTKSESFGELLNSIDLFVDTSSHFGALSTGIEILSTGCPLISIDGPTLFSCHATSLLRTVGVADSLLCTDMTDMLHKIQALVVDDDAFSQLCSRVRSGMQASRLNDVEFRAQEFSVMLTLLEAQIDAGTWEDIMVPDAANN